MAAISNVSICNVALAALGGDAIASLEVSADSTTLEQLCAFMYEHHRRNLLSMAWWTFARVQGEELNLLSSVSPQFYSYAYQLPSACLKPFYIDESKLYKKWEVVGQHLYTDLTPVYLSYVSDYTVAAKFPPWFAHALAMIMKAELAPKHTQDKKMWQVYRSEAEVWILRAIETDAQIGDSTKEQHMDPDWDTFANPNAAGMSIDFPWTNPYSASG